MDSVTYLGIELLLVASDATGQCWQRWMPVPPSVDEAELARYVEHMFGPVLHEVDTGNHLPGPAGWMLDATAAGLEDLPPSADRLQVLPHVRLDSGDRQPLPDYRSWLGSAFAALVGATVPAAAPTGRPGRLDSEELEFIGDDDWLVELQLRGWLQRMVDEGGTYLTICLGERGRYVQFLVDNERRTLVAETVSNHHLEPFQELTVAEEAALSEAGWLAPEHGTSANYWAHWPLPSSAALSHPSRSDDPPETSSPCPQVLGAAHLAAHTICSVFAPDRAHRVAVDVGSVGADTAR